MADWVWTALSAVGGVGMAACLFFMYGDKRRCVPALKAIDRNFQSLDMRRRYTPAEAFACFEGVGEAGRRLLAGMWKLDFVFMVFFWMVMAAVGHNVATMPLIQTVMLCAATLRLALDAGENLLLLNACAAYPGERREKEISAASLLTTLKWGMMAIWVLGLFGCLLAQSIS